MRYEKWLNKSVFYGSFNLLRCEHEILGGSMLYHIYAIIGLSVLLTKCFFPRLEPAGIGRNLGEK